MVIPNERKPVVAHVVRGYPAATETFIVNQIISLQRYQPTVLCHDYRKGLGYPDQSVISIQQQLPLPLRIIDRIAYQCLRTSISQGYKALSDSILANKAVILHFHFLVDARFFIDLKRLTGLPAIVSAYGYDVSSFPRRYGGLGHCYLRPVFSKLGAFLAMSQDMRKDLLALGCPEEKIIVHYQGVDTSRFAYPNRQFDEKEVLTILSCGTLAMKKAQHLTLQALYNMEKAKLTSRRFRVVFVGDGPMRQRLEQQVKDYGWQEKVSFLGHIPHTDPQLVSAYHDADIFSLPSITFDHAKEGIPGVIVEAMAARLPVLSTYHSGIPEIIESGRDGILVREGDIGAMATAFAALLENPDLRRKLGTSAAKRAANELDLRQCTANLEDIYDEISE